MPTVNSACITSRLCCTAWYSMQPWKICFPMQSLFINSNKIVKMPLNAEQIGHIYYVVQWEHILSIIIWKNPVFDKKRDFFALRPNAIAVFITESPRFEIVHRVITKTTAPTAKSKISMETGRCWPEHGQYNMLTYRRKKTENSKLPVWHGRRH